MDKSAKKILVGMDISQLAHQGGVATYLDNLTLELSKIEDLEMIYFYSSLRKPYHGYLKNIKKYRLPPTLFEMLFNRWRNISIEKFLGPMDVFHSSDWTQPPSKAKKVTTYHDVVPLKYPAWSHPRIVSVHKRRLKLVEKEIDMVIAVSESTKKDLLKITRIPEEKITVIYEGVSGNMKPAQELEKREFKLKHNLPDKFVLSIGGVGERRNLDRVKEASKNYNLIIAGVDFPWVSDEELPLLYSSADVLLYPSFYEGFGLPILEAFACGVPVITSNVSSMPEVGGEAAIYVDPQKPAEIEEKLKEVLGDKSVRENLIKKGFEQVKKFSWQKCAEQTADVYRKLSP